MVEDTNQAVHTIKQLLERMVIPQAQLTTRLRSAVEGLRVEQLVIKASSCRNSTSSRHANSLQVTRSKVESTRSAITIRRRHDEAGTSLPQNKTTSGCTTRLEAPIKSREREPTEDALRPSHNIFNRLGRNRDEDMRTHLEARHNSATSRRREYLPIAFVINDEVNEMRARLEKLATRSTEATLSMSTSPFSAEIQQVPLPAGFRMPTMATYEGKTYPQDHLDAFNDQMDLLQVTTRPLQMFCNHIVRDNEEVDETDRIEDHRLLGTTLCNVYALVPRST